MIMDAGFDSAGRKADTWAGQTKADSRDSSARPAASRNGADTDPPDPEKLARDWITLWQSELSAMAVDREMHEASHTIMALWAGTISAVLREFRRGWAPSPEPTPRQRDDRRDGPCGPDDRSRPDNQSGAADATRAAPADAAPDPRNAEIERLTRSVAALERRLEDLERGGDPPVDPERRPRRKPRK